MKKRILFLLVVVVLSCSEDDAETDTTDIVNEELVGTWRLINVSCFCAFPDPPAFEQTQIIFSDEVNTVEVVNSGTTTYFKDDGTYTYTFTEEQINFEDGTDFTFDRKQAKLALIFVDNPNIADDEIAYTFERR
jgi:hypothetical protein